MSDLIFSFGTLQLESVQQALFGRAVPTTPDSLAGWVVGETRITDPEAIAASGTDLHPALLAGGPGDVVTGGILEVTPEELAAADHYERVSYRRIPVRLQSGRDAWAYVPKDQT